MQLGFHPVEREADSFAAAQAPIRAGAIIRMSVMAGFCL
jgi:hypothetical protein